MSAKRKHGLAKLAHDLKESVLGRNSFAKERGRWYAVRIVFKFWRWGWMTIDDDKPG